MSERAITSSVIYSKEAGQSRSFASVLIILPNLSLVYGFVLDLVMKNYARPWL